MCGIAGIIRFDGLEVRKSEIVDICASLNFRGPDSDGYFVKESVGLGHKRLAIIDIENGIQPMFSADRSVVAIFNGEVYNFLELRSRLIDDGHLFKTHSDTEVLIEAYKAYGIKKMLNLIEGMFAFAIYDLQKSEIFIARDKFGEKPIFFYERDKVFYFASELKAFNLTLASMNICRQALNMFLSLSYIPAPYTIYDGVYKLEAGHYLTISLDGSVKNAKYYDILDHISDKNHVTTFEEAKVSVRDLLFESVRRRLISDVPVGIFLSGGVDSSIIAAIAARLQKDPISTFSMGFAEREYDESERALLVAKKIGSNHTNYILDYADVVSTLDELILHYDEPFGDSSMIPTYFVSKLARKNVKVVLSGDCADEIFGGYEKYLFQWYSEKLSRVPKLFLSLMKAGIKLTPHGRLTNSFLRRTKKVIDNLHLSGFDMHYHFMNLGCSDAARKCLLKAEYFFDVKDFIYRTFSEGDFSSSLQRSLYTDLKVVVEGDMLVKVDRVSMKNSLEVRVPFLDSKLVESAFAMPISYKIRGKVKKYVLREAFRDLLPAKTLQFRKKGFGVPVDYWFKTHLRNELLSLFRREDLISQGIFEYDVIENLIHEHLVGKQNHKSILWNLYVFQKWFRAKR
jgi:asparagine synthase (glutamine-hydrolysing)